MAEWDTMMPGIVGVKYVRIKTDDGPPTLPRLSTGTQRKPTPTG
jgi:hypothetical protein